MPIRFRGGGKQQCEYKEEQKKNAPIKRCSFFFFFCFSQLENWQQRWFQRRISREAGCLEMLALGSREPSLCTQTGRVLKSPGKAACCLTNASKDNGEMLSSCQASQVSGSLYPIKLKVQEMLNPACLQSGSQTSSGGRARRTENDAKVA